MKKLLSFLAITLLVRSFVSIDSTMKCKRMGLEQRNSTLNVEDEILSTSDYLEFNNEIIEKIPTIDYEPLNFDNLGNIYFQDGEQLLIYKPSEKNTFKIDGIKLHTNRSNQIFVDRLNTVFVGTHSGLYFVTYDGTSAAQLRATNNITVDFGITDSYGNIYFGTNGSNTDASEQLYVYNRKDKILTKLEGVETTFGAYPIESRGNRNKIAIDSKNNVYVGAYSNYVYMIKSGDSVATKIKTNDDGSVTSIVVDSKDNVYCRTYADLYIFKNNKFIKILETLDYFDLFLMVDGDDNLHFRITNDEYVLKPKEITAIELMLTDPIKLSKNVMVRNDIFYFTTRADDDGKETIFTLKQFETNITEIYKSNKFYSIAVDNNNNIFFTADSSKISNKIVPYVLRMNAKMPIEIRGIKNRLSSKTYADNKNNVYFSASNGLHVLNFDEVVPHRLRTTGSQINSLVIAKNNHIYFVTDYDGAYVLKAGESDAIKISNINKEQRRYGPSGIKTFVDKNYDEIVYFQANNTLYKLMSSDTVANIVIDRESFQFYLSDCEHNLYYINGNDVFLLKSDGQSIAEKISYVVGHILAFDIDSSNNLYFGTNLGLQVLRTSETVVSLVKVTVPAITDTTVSVLAIDQNDNVYFGMDGNAFFLKSGEMEATKIHGINGDVVKVFVNNYDIYFITNMGKSLFLLQNKLEFGKLFKNRILGEIDDDHDETILNTLNFFNSDNNYLLNLSKNKVIQKTDTSAIIVANKGKYIGQFNVKYKIVDRTENGRKFFVDVDFLKKAIYFNYINENLFHYKKTKEIKSIDVFIDNLRFSPVEISKRKDMGASVDFKTVCSMKTVANSSPLNQIIKFPECSYTGKEIVSFEITTGINTPNQIKPVLTPDDETIVSDFLYNNESNSNPVMLSNSFQISKLNFFTQERDLYDFVEPEQDIVVPPKQKVLLKYSVRSFSNQIHLSLTQKIHGVIVAKVTDNNEEKIIQITLRTAMQVLEKYSQLPIEVIINDDNSITFNGSAILISSSESQPNVIRNFLDANMP